MEVTLTVSNSQGRDGTFRPAVLAAVALAGVGMVIVVAAVFISAYHRPSPNRVPIGLAGPPQVVQQISQGLGSAGDTFAVHSYASEAALRSAVAHRSVYGGMAFTGQTSADIILASANGSAATGTVQGALAGIAGQAHLTTRQVDVSPLPSTDSAGLSVFFLVFALALASTSAGVAFLLTRARLVDGLLAGVAIAVVGGLAGALISVSWLSAPPDHFLGVWVVSAAALFTMTMFALACVRALRAAGLGIAAILIAIIGTAASGGAINTHFYPPLWRAVGPLLPNGAAVTLTTNTAYFPHAAIAGPTLVLVIWAVLSIAVLAVADAIRNRGATPTGTSAGRRATSPLTATAAAAE